MPNSERPPAKGMTAKAISAGTSTMIGAAVNTALSTRTGVMSSFRKSFSTSAIGWRMPCGPTRIGPRRTCTQACTFRSSSTMYITVVSTAASTVTIMINGTMTVSTMSRVS